MILLNDDCLNALKKMESNSVDLIVTSPPYDNLRNYEDSLEWNLEIFKKIADELSRVLAFGGVIVWIVNDATISGSESGTSFKQALYFKEKCGLNLHDTMIWQKDTFTAVGSIKTRYAPVFEYMFVFSKGLPKAFNPIKDKPNKSCGKKYNGTIRQVDGSTKPVCNIGKEINKFGIRYNVWNISPEKSNAKRFHPAQFPESLAHDHILSWSNHGDTVLDPFMGSGTTGIQAKLLGRKYIGIEKVAKYFEIASKRINGS